MTKRKQLTTATFFTLAINAALCASIEQRYGVPAGSLIANVLERCPAIVEHLL
jgi:hypothetical protein